MIITVTALFWDDHSDRFADNKKLKWRELHRTQNIVTIDVNELEYHNLVNDARYYADNNDKGWISECAGLRRSAIATLKRLHE